MAEADIGMAGVGVMGSNLALNMERNGFAVVVWDRDQFKPYLEKGDILIDGGNSWFEDTRRREAALLSKDCASSDQAFPAAKKARCMDPA